MLQSKNVSARGAVDNRSRERSRGGVRMFFVAYYVTLSLSLSLLVRDRRTRTHRIRIVIFGWGTFIFLSVVHP